jgi:hypothetical protein
MLMDISDSMLRSQSKSLRKLLQEKDNGLATAHESAREKLNLFPYKVTAVQELKPARIDSRRHHFQHLLYVHSDFPNALYVSQYSHYWWLIEKHVKQGSASLEYGHQSGYPDKFLVV